MEEFAQSSGEDGIAMLSLKSIIKKLKKENTNIISGPCPDPMES